ncbi:YcfL family protein [Vibrio maerlii]|uniref:YcfL family protein n=1 Tax=Vibrio maerlii TaxID=2231648 RepID=UPI000E3EB6D6|nr:DUF1425 domain-containing protein [Vibrio maerlii]
MKKWIVALGMAVILAGCADNTAGLNIDGQSQKIIFADNVLGSRLNIDSIRTVQADDRARGIVQFSSQYKGDQIIQYRFYWYDDQGLEVNTKLAPWRRVVVRGFESFSISEASVNPNGTQFRVTIREAE